MPTPPNSRANPRRSMDFEKLIPTDFRGQTVNGSVRAGNAPGWNQDYDWSNSPADAARPTWKDANRSGE